MALRFGDHQTCIQQLGEERDGRRSANPHMLDQFSPGVAPPFHRDSQDSGSSFAGQNRFDPTRLGVRHSDTTASKTRLGADIGSPVGLPSGLIDLFAQPLAAIGPLDRFEAAPPVAPWVGRPRLRDLQTWTRQA